ncbi:MAG: XRE family transcriptional regulator [Rhodospirillales bacterium]|nr:XRE family transcriptional regulator [Rhodospirillales bacterium]MDP7424102.1 XRE family transcriptional regulator [Rhodospirillales bacterium]
MAKNKAKLTIKEQDVRDLRIGDRLAEIRKSRGLTLAKLSTMSAVSEATLSRAENGVGSLNAHNLYILSKVLEVDITVFFRADSVSFGKGMRTITRKNEGEIRRTDRYDLELLGAELAHKKMVPSKNHITAMSLDEAGGLRSHEGEEFIYVLSGKVVIHTEFYVPTILEEGDSMYFDSNMGHAYTVTNDEGAKILVTTAVDNE